MKWQEHLNQSYNAGVEAGKQSSLSTNIGTGILTAVVTVAVNKVWNDTEFGHACQKKVHDAVDGVKDFFGW